MGYIFFIFFLVFIDIFILCFYLLYFLFKLWRPKDYNLETIFRFLHCRWIIIICNLVVFKIGLHFLYTA